MKIERALKNTGDKSTYTNGNGLPSDEQRKEILEKEYRILEEEYKMVIKRLEYASELWNIMWNAHWLIKTTDGAIVAPLIILTLLSCIRYI